MSLCHKNTNFTRSCVCMYIQRSTPKLYKIVICKICVIKENQPRGKCRAVLLLINLYKTRESNFEVDIYYPKFKVWLK